MISLAFLLAVSSTALEIKVGYCKKQVFDFDGFLTYSYFNQEERPNITKILISFQRESPLPEI